MSSNQTEITYCEVDGVMYEVDWTDFNPSDSLSLEDFDDHLASSLTNFLAEDTQAYPSPDASIAQSSPEGFAAPLDYTSPTFTSTPTPYPGLTTPNPLPANSPPALTNHSTIYGPFQGLFSSGEQAQTFRETARGTAKPDPTVAWVKQTQRVHWVTEIYHALVDVSAAIDGPKCPHLLRFKTKAVFSQAELEAAAHNVFDEACAVHEKGWCHPLVYRKEAKRGDLVDKSSGSVARRLESICALLRKSKSACNDAMMGGLTLAKLVDNPYAHGAGKTTNLIGNSARGEVLRAGKDRVAGGRVGKKGVEKRSKLIC